MALACFTRTEMLSIETLLAALAIERPLFHSEADFQHSFAWLLQRQHLDASIRLELPVRVLSSVLHLDLLVSLSDRVVAVELNYKTRGLDVSVSGEDFRLANQAAQDLGRYDFIKDIVRLETLVGQGRINSGHAVLLTNEASYWSAARDSDPVDAAYRLSSGRVLSGSLGWNQRASAGTIRGRELPLSLTGSYPIVWRDYSQIHSAKCGAFKYLAITVTGGAG